MKSEYRVLFTRPNYVKDDHVYTMFSITCIFRTHAQNDLFEYWIFSLEFSVFSIKVEFVAYSSIVSHETWG